LTVQPPALWQRSFPALLVLMIASARAESSAHGDACFVRPEPTSAAAASSVVPAATESRLGIRRKAAQLFDVELSVVGAGGAVCSVAGVARLRAGDVLALPVRADGGGSKAAAAPCLVYFRAVPQGVEITTTEAACQAQSLCATQVRLHGQRFEAASRLPETDRSRCFAGPAS
jgi:hypothetical protein